MTEVDRKLDSMAADQSKRLETMLNKLLQDIFQKHEIINNYELRQREQEKQEEKQRQQAKKQKEKE